MPSKSPLLALSGIATNISLARQFVAGLSFHDFRQDTKTLYAVIRCLEIVSEASRRLPPELLARHPEIPWVQIARAGNVYRHEYDGVREAMIWKTIHGALDALEVVVREELSRLSESRD
ncbi:DUF86 domain-containing protein [Rhodoplanes sp. TEM]|uniref:DUF86 domain-containing protein n=1 Tax=Rhodoplanes tepidamans TaxID=200616 RepID=A0ABT5J4J4_RHOTP|nr:MULTISPECIES: HepT-like ribonuclease domain-containing protein [Rhodoplanes]MDC7784554.1 DUF86 domain-containing protein [Rhodoplanes tepidamans]MDC7984461.1 DUF86 domain-containing protein [Rhodoplanes sp. TEM]MDQ0355782.1 uncharacterized protein with HEPN domain [Rhodoplanes tepidamans]